jgi:hypothetical protein
MLLWTAYVLLAVRIVDGWRQVVAGWLTASGAGPQVVTLVPEWPLALRSLDRPLNLAPATDTMLFALQTHVGVRQRFGGVGFAGRTAGRQWIPDAVSIPATRHRGNVDRVASPMKATSHVNPIVVQAPRLACTSSVSGRALT